MLEALYKNNGFVNSSFIQYLKMLIKPQPFQSFWSVGSISLTLISKNQRLGVKDGSEAGVPRPGIQAQRPEPAPHASHARHDRSMARDDSGGRVESWPIFLPTVGVTD